jgi:hypothetical protein
MEHIKIKVNAIIFAMKQQETPMLIYANKAVIVSYCSTVKLCAKFNC